MLQILEKIQLVVDHLLVALDILLQNDLDGDLAGRAICFADNAVRACAKCITKAVFGPKRKRRWGVSSFCGKDVYATVRNGWS